jgi:hypothetical protein
LNTVLTHFAKYIPKWVVNIVKESILRDEHRLICTNCEAQVAARQGGIPPD